MGISQHSKLVINAVDMEPTEGEERYVRTMLRSNTNWMRHFKVLLDNGKKSSKLKERHFNVEGMP